MRERSDSLKVWHDELKKFEVKDKSKYNLTKDTVQRRLRPEPEIIEHILEGLEDKIRHYFNLFKLEKEKRSSAEKNNYYLQEEVAKAYEALEKNKIYTMKLEEKLSNIKDNQSSLIDTVRRIDLLYIQLDTLVQSFAGVCTQTAAEVSEDTSNIEKKRNTIKMLLDYIYPCRTLDPRINALYGLLYYQTIGLLKDGKYSCPPIPPIPPVVPSQDDGWLPPSHFHHGNIDHMPILKENNFSDMVKRNNEENNKLDKFRSRNISEHKLEKNTPNYDDSIIPRDLLGFDIKIGLVEINYPLENPKIVCVVRYDHETAYSAIQNSKRVTKPKNPDEILHNGIYIFNVDNTINLNTLPHKIPGTVPSFRIDVHDVRGKLLVGTSKCSFISEKTLVKNAPWDIYSRIDKNNPKIIGKMYVSVYQYPSKSVLPAEVFKHVKESKFSDNSSINRSQIILQNTQKSLTSNTKIGLKGKLITKKSIVLSKDIIEKAGIQKSEEHKVQTKLQIIKNNNNTLIQRGKKVSFKPYSSKKEIQGLKTEDVKELNESSIDVKGKIFQKGIYKRIIKDNNHINNNNNSASITVKNDGSHKNNDNNTKNDSNNSIDNNANKNVNNNIDNNNNTFTNNNINTKKMENILDDQHKNKPSNVKNLIKDLSKKIELGKPGTIKPFTLKSPLKMETKNKNISAENELEKKELTENKKNSLNNEELVINSEKMEDGKIKIKLPLYQKKDALTKAKVTEQINNVDDNIKSKIKESAPTKSDSVDQKLTSKNILKPLLKIKVEPKKENLNKILKIINIKPSNDKNANKESEINKSSKQNLNKEIENKNFTPNIEAKINEKFSKNSENEKSNPTILEKKKELGIKKPLSIFKLNTGKKEPNETKKKFSLFNFKKPKNEDTEKDETNTKNAEVSKIMKKPVTKKDTIIKQTSVENSELKKILEDAKKKSIFIDKSKIKMTLLKKVELKKEIKKFVPKLKFGQ
ncbi:conserved Plasmodium protein, unknown function [Plasmodium gallinaceum]|uniref:Uncharacterized protein n=1 Tax=Plasmodium gallinaceum TaxID=5849 RepID=A0A1J1GRF5_PLAGA|nr:conserved Plasmodium protein, unknown function [Plasmodium gallinaceum]CRG95045.1 conserved Plasmodium protein, unknown function [Plasmodium gallinaceum]